jgi:predicted ATPase/DNA-binding SARP family transcriptional activator
MANLSLYLLGAPRVKLGENYIEVKPRKALALLIYLAVTADRHARDSLATLLWPNSDQRKARHALRSRLSELKLTLGADWIEMDQDLVSLRAGFWLDVSEFHHYLAEDANDPQHLVAAVELYRDYFLSGFTLPDCPEFDEWQFYQSESLQQSLSSALERLSALLSDQSDFEKAVSHARRRLALDPLHEPAHRQLMQLYARTGRYTAALRQYHLCHQVLDRELGVSPSPEITALYNDIRTRRPKSVDPHSPAWRPPRHNLPTQTSLFIGRESELADIKGLLLGEPACRLLSLIGPGGIGKTRLALAAAARIRDSFPDGVYFVSLVPVGKVELIVPTIAKALNFNFHGRTNPKELLLDYLRQKELLLVVDNFEHLLDGAHLLAEILRYAPGVTLLATSRERLNLQEEWVLEVRGLPFPDGDDRTSEVAATLHPTATSEALTSYSAVQLFMQRARQSETSFEPTADEMADIGRICRLVEGMPLALELSAPWIKVLNCQEIAGEIQRSLDFLTTSFQDMPERHRSLRVVFEQTWERLSTAERTVLKQLSVFRSGCTREAAELVTGATLPVLASLVDKALLRRTNLGRYEMHELLRQYTSARLDASGQCETAQEAHCFYFTTFLHHREADLKGRRQVAALNEIEADFDNVRAAWQWAVSCKKYEVVGLALESICLFCVMRNRYQGCLELLRLGREQLAPAAGERPHPIWGRILARAPSPARVFLEPLADVRARVEIALTIAREHGDQAEVAFCLWRLGVAVLSDSDNFSEALACCEQSLTLYQALDDRFYQAKLLDQAGIWCLRLNQSERGASSSEQVPSLHRDLGDKLASQIHSARWGGSPIIVANMPRAEASWQKDTF